MGYDDRRWGSNDDRYGRGRDEYRGGGGGYGRPGGYDRDDRGFFQRAGDEVRSWFGDEEAERRRQYDERYDDRYDRGDRDRSYGQREGGSYSNYGSYGSGGGYGGSYGASGGSRDFGSRGDYRSGSAYGRSQGGYGGGRDESRGRDDNDSLVSGYGWAGSDRSRGSYGQGQGAGGYGRSQSQSRQGGQDDNYGSWRDRQMQSFDRDYDEYRRENQSRFESEFASYRTKRQGQRDLLGKVSEHDEVLGSDGQHVGKVDHIQGDRLKLAKNDQAAGGHHHYIPSSWIEQVADNKVTLSKTADEAKRAWREAQDDGDKDRGLFGQSRDNDRDGDRSSGGGNLNRSFSGTY